MSALRPAVFACHIPGRSGRSPVGASRNPALPPPEAVSSPNNHATVLIVEDNLDNRMIYRTILEHFGYEVLEACDGEAGVRMAREHRPDAVVMDISIPIINGHEATRILKADAATASIPIMALPPMRCRRTACMRSRRAATHTSLSPPSPSTSPPRWRASSRKRARGTPRPDPHPPASQPAARPHRIGSPGVPTLASGGGVTHCGNAGARTFCCTWGQNAGSATRAARVSSRSATNSAGSRSTPRAPRNGASPRRLGLRECHRAELVHLWSRARVSPKRGG